MGKPGIGIVSCAGHLGTDNDMSAGPSMNLCASQCARNFTPRVPSLDLLHFYFLQATQAHQPAALPAANRGAWGAA